MMNDLTRVIERHSDPTTFKFRLSTLYAWIRCFETLLHVSCRLEINVWQVRSEKIRKQLMLVKLIFNAGLEVI